MKKHTGFTLLELSIVLIVIALVIGGVMIMLTQDTRRTKQAELKVKMDNIEAALIAFRERNNRLPCPADGTEILSATSFGYEGSPNNTASGNCINSSSYDGNGNRSSIGASPAANFYNSTYANVVGGVVPTRTLNLPDDAMFDPWGGRFTYIVDQRMTGATTTAASAPAFTSYPPRFLTASTATNVGAIAVNDQNGNLRTLVASAIAVVISHGPNGHGAFQLSGARKSSGSTNANELTNCHCTSSAAGGLFTATVVAQANSSTYSSSTIGYLLNSFDDVVRYYTRDNFVSGTETLADVP